MKSGKGLVVIGTAAILVGGLITLIVLDNIEKEKNVKFLV